MDQITKVKLNNLRVSPRKVRLVADLIRGMNAAKAQKQLTFLAKKVALPMLKMLNSGLANAKSNFDLEPEKLVIKSIFVNEGSTMKRWMPRAMGRATQIRKRTSHIEMTLEPILKKDIKKVTKQKSQPEIVTDKMKEKELPKQKAEKEDQKDVNRKAVEKRPFGASGSAKDRNFSRQTAGGHKMFRRKSI